VSGFGGHHGKPCSTSARNVRSSTGRSRILRRGTVSISRVRAVALASSTMETGGEIIGREDLGAIRSMSRALAS